MVDKQKWLIKKGYLKNFEEYVKVYNLESCTEVILNKSEVESLKISGSYIIKNGSIIALYKYDNVLYLVLNERTFNLSNRKLKLSVEYIDRKSRGFYIYSDDILIEQFEYERQRYITFDPWSDEDDVDYFAWLTKLYNQDRLSKLY